MKFPDSLIAIYRDHAHENPLKGVDELLAEIPKQPEHHDYILTLIVWVYQHKDKNIALEKAIEYLPQIKEKECRADLERTIIFHYEAANQYDKALEYYFLLVEDDTYGYHNYDDIARAYVKLDDMPNALKYYEMYAEAQNYNCDEDVFVEIAEAYEKVNDYKNSARYYEMGAVFMSYETDTWWTNVGRAYALDGNETEATFYFKMALKIEPKNAWPHYYLGLIQQNKKNMYRAIHHYTEALKIDSTLGIVYNNLASIAFNDEGNIGKAIKNIEKALEVDPESGSLYLFYKNLTKLYEKIQDEDKADFYRRKMINHPDFEDDIFEMLSAIGKGYVTFGDDDEDEYDGDEDEDDDDELAQ